MSTSKILIWAAVGAWTAWHVMIRAGELEE